MSLNVPEIASGLVEIKSIAREAGSRTKLAVLRLAGRTSTRSAPASAPAAARVGAVVERAARRKDGHHRLVGRPGEVRRLGACPRQTSCPSRLLPGSAKACRVIVPDDQLSLAIGKEGQNARLAARLTGYKIDIKPESQADICEEDEFAQALQEAQEAAEAEAQDGSSRRRSTGRCTRGRRCPGSSPGETRRINRLFDHPGRTNLRAEKNTHARSASAVGK